MLAHFSNISNALNVVSVSNTLTVWNTCLLLGWMVGCVDCVAALVGGGWAFPGGEVDGEGRGEASAKFVML